MSTYTTEEYKGCKIKIMYDEDPHEGPRDWDCNYTTMICFHNRYGLGDVKESNYWESARKNCRSWEELWEEIQKGYDIIVAKPLYLYDHSGLAISTGSFIGRAQHARWDSGQIGFVFITRESVENLQGWKRITKSRREQLKKWLDNEVSVYDDYVRGNVFGYNTETPDGEHIDSCWGFYGTDWEENGLFSHAKPSIDYYIKEQKESYQQKLKTLIKNNVPLHIRQQKLHKPAVL